MLPPRTRLDPDGYYIRLGLEPAATAAEIVAAFRGKVRILHPDVPNTGNASEFVAVKQAYDVLSNPQRRDEYDRMAREAAMDAIEPEVMVVQPASYPMAPVRQPRFSDLPAAVWIGSAVFLCLCLYEVVTHLLATPPRIANQDIRPNAAVVTPLSPSAHQAVLYSPEPTHLAGAPNFYVVPAATPAVLFHIDHNALVPLRQLPPFSSVQAIRLIRQNGMLEVLLDDHGKVSGTMQLENRAVQPAVVKLRDGGGRLALAVFLAPGGDAEVDGPPNGQYRMEFAIGELWSRGCNTFAAGMRAMRRDAVLDLPGDAHLVVAPDAGPPDAEDISDQTFQQD